MPSISLPTVALIAVAGTAVSAGVTAYAAHEQGAATASMNKQKARAEAISEQQKQIGMRQNMLRALASQHAGGLGAVSMGVGTSAGANTQRQIDQAQNDMMVSRSNSATETSLLDQAGANAQSAGNLAAVGALASGTARVYGA